MLRKALKVLGILIAVIILLLIVGHLAFVSIVTIEPPEVPESEFTSLTIDTVSVDHYALGANWLRLDDSGIWVGYIEGEPYDRGVAFGRLAKDLAQDQEEIFIAQTQRMIGTGIGSRLLRYFVGWFNRDIDDHVPLEYRQEIYGVSQSFSDDYNWVGTKYQRLLNYHAAHDIGHALEDLAKVGCSSFALQDNYTSDSSLLVGRNFDFYMGRDFAKQRLLLFCQPSVGYAYTSYTWAGMMGILSGMNAQGLTVTINAAKSEVPTGAKTPISILAREVLQYASTIEDAINICKRRELFVSESLLVVSAVQKRSAIIEVSPTGLDVFESDGQVTICTNHYQSDLYKDSQENLDWIDNSDSEYRFQLLDSLIEDSHPVSVRDAADILSNPYGKGNRLIGLGNPKTINQFIGHHSVIFRPQNLQLWVSSYPNPLETGFYAFSMQDLNVGSGIIKSIDSLGIRPSPEQRMIHRSFESYWNYREKLQSFIIDDRKIEWTSDDERTLVQNYSNYYDTFLTLGMYYQKQGDTDKAKEYYLRSLDCELPSKTEEQNIRTLLAAINK